MQVGYFRYSRSTCSLFVPVTFLHVPVCLCAACTRSLLGSPDSWESGDSSIVPEASLGYARRAIYGCPEVASLTYAPGGETPVPTRVYTTGQRYTIVYPPCKIGTWLQRLPWGTLGELSPGTRRYLASRTLRAARLPRSTIPSQDLHSMSLLPYASPRSLVLLNSWALRVIVPK